MYDCVTRHLHPCGSLFQILNRTLSPVNVTYMIVEKVLFGCSEEYLELIGKRMVIFRMGCFFCLFGFLVVFFLHFLCYFCFRALLLYIFML